MSVATGTIKKIVADRGFGFITGEDGKDYFFHRDALEASLVFERLVGDEKVEFDAQSSPRGPRAINVRRA
jgi:CspA family cold shock protein